MIPHGDTQVVVSSYEDFDPHSLLQYIGGTPNIDFFWKEDANGKRRLIGNPNKASRRLHKAFEDYIRVGITHSAEKLPNEFLGLKKLRSSTAFVKGSNPLINAQKHVDGKFFYITDLSSAYKSISLEKLAILLVYIKKFDDYGFIFSMKQLVRGFGDDEVIPGSLYVQMLSFLKIYCSGMHGHGLAVGGVISPYLMNLFCEAYLDSPIRAICREDGITYTRYADDLVFSSESKPIFSEVRKQIRACIKNASLNVNHRKSKILSKEMGTVFVTKIGLRYKKDWKNQTESVVVFPKRKRSKLHGIIGSYLKKQMDWPEKVSGYVAEFLHYFKNVKNPTASDMKTFTLCKEFEKEWDKYRKK